MTTTSQLVFTEQTITLAMHAGFEPRQIKAQVCGHLAYHRTLATRLSKDGFGDTWTVTHVPTGYGVADFIPTEDAAQRVLRAALGSGVDWSKGLDYFKRNRKGKRVRECCALMRAALVGEIGL